MQHCVESTKAPHYNKIKYNSDSTLYAVECSYHDNIVFHFLPSTTNKPHKA